LTAQPHPSAVSRAHARETDELDPYHAGAALNAAD
jgi:hypothetical protein